MPDAWAIQVGAQPAEGVDSPASITVEEVFRLLVDRLSPLQRAAVVLRELLGFSVREAAALLQTSEGAVKVAMHRARRTLSAVQDGKNGQEGVTQLLRKEDGGPRQLLHGRWPRRTWQGTFPAWFKPWLLVPGPASLQRSPTRAPMHGRPDGRR